MLSRPPVPRCDLVRTAPVALSAVEKSIRAAAGPVGQTELRSLRWRRRVETGNLRKQDSRGRVDGRGGRIRTDDPLLPKQVR